MHGVVTIPPSPRQEFLYTLALDSGPGVRTQDPTVPTPKRTEPIPIETVEDAEEGSNREEGESAAGIKHPRMQQGHDATEEQETDGPISTLASATPVQRGSGPVSGGGVVMDTLSTLGAGVMANLG